MKQCDVIGQPISVYGRRRRVAICTNYRLRLTDELPNIFIRSQKQRVLIGRTEIEISQCHTKRRRCKSCSQLIIFHLLEQKLDTCMTGADWRAGSWITDRPHVVVNHNHNKKTRIAHAVKEFLER